jgi:hypothetical protein
VSFLPNASELTSHLAIETSFPPGETAELSKVAQYFNVVGGRDALDQELHAIFNALYDPSPLHTFLAAAPAPLLIVTTNYDDMVEQALRAAGRPFDLIVHTTDVKLGYRLLWWQHGESEPHEVNQKEIDIDLDKVTVLYKMHGAVDRQLATRDQYVITEDDYIEFLSRMTKNKAIPNIFAEPFQTRHFLFLGYGLRDWNLRVVLNRVEKDIGRTKGIKSWAIQRDPSPLERRFWQDRGVEVFDLSLDEFVAKLSGP